MNPAHSNLTNNLCECWNHYVARQVPSLCAGTPQRAACPWIVHQDSPPPIAPMRSWWPCWTAWGGAASMGELRRHMCSLTDRLQFCQSSLVSVFFWYLSSIRVSGDPFSKLPVPHKLAILATMDEVSLILLNVSYQSSNTDKKAPELHICSIF